MALRAVIRVVLPKADAPEHHPEKSVQRNALAAAAMPPSASNAHPDIAAGGDSHDQSRLQGGE